MLAGAKERPEDIARAGIKASGGIRTVAEAAIYIGLVADLLGAQALVPQRFRLGASALLDDIESVLGGRPVPADDRPY